MEKVQLALSHEPDHGDARRTLARLQELEGSAR
jgi:hypothetical protein